MKRVDMAGCRSGRIILLSRAEDSAAGLDRWHYQCDCGKTGIAAGHKIRDQSQKSCGCGRTETIRQINPGLRHGHARGKKLTPEWMAWASMRSRCTDANSRAYPNYGGRGIMVCERWQTFENFLADMGPRPSIKHSLDRFPDNNGDYEPSNCRWATKKQQSRNQRGNIIVDFRGAQVALSEAAEMAGLSYQTVWKRINKYGWTTERALTEPIHV